MCNKKCKEHRVCDGVTDKNKVNGGEKHMRDIVLHHKWRYRHAYNQTISLRKDLSIYFQ